jgi:hypothetical protein
VPENRHNASTAFGTATMRPLVAAAALAIAIAGAARAQVTGPIPNTGYDDGRFNWYALPLIGRHAPQDAGEDRELERRYRETLRTKIPDKKPSNDPWRNIRPSAADRHRAE